MKICDREKCTGCGACINICATQCIVFEKDEYGTKYPIIDEDKCVKCGRCIKVCPNNMEYDFTIPIKTYAVWSNNQKLRAAAASGGVASEIYEYALKHKILINGVKFQRNTGVYHFILKENDDLLWARDSKYVFSDMEDIYKEYKEYLRINKKCIFIGLPCQVAAIKSYLRMNCINDENLVTIELICHGTPNWEYLDKHLENIEKKKKKNISKVSFRDPLYLYYFRAFDKKNKRIYSAGMHEGDLYYRGFATNLDFRENCYSCNYARKERIADITLGDFSGLGRAKKYEWDTKKVSLVLVNTQKGKEFFDMLIDNCEMHVTEREYEEAYLAEGNHNLRKPSVKHKNRNVFLANYVKYGDYDKAAAYALKYEIDEWNKIKNKVLIKRFVLALIPRKMKNLVKSLMKTKVEKS